jgi:hypothetical protein
MVLSANVVVLYSKRIGRRTSLYTKLYITVYVMAFPPTLASASK